MAEIKRLSALYQAAVDKGHEDGWKKPVEAYMEELQSPPAPNPKIKSISRERIKNFFLLELVDRALPTGLLALDNEELILILKLLTGRREVIKRAAQLYQLYDDEFEVIDGLRQHKNGLTFKRWLKKNGHVIPDIKITENQIKRMQRR